MTVTFGRGALDRVRRKLAEPAPTRLDRIMAGNRLRPAPWPPQGSVDAELYQSQVWNLLLVGDASRAELRAIDAARLIGWLQGQGCSAVVAANRILKLMGLVS